MTSSNIRLPHGPGFRLVHEIIEHTLSPDTVTGVYRYDGLGGWLAGDHFPGNPIMPGAKQISTMFDAALKTIALRSEVRKKMIDLRLLLIGLRDIEFKSQVRPDSHLVVTAISQRSGEWETAISCQVTTDRREIARGILMFDNAKPRVADPITHHSVYTGKEFWLAGGLNLPPEMILEAMAQNAIQIAQFQPDGDQKLFLFSGIENAHFYGPVPPESEISLNATIMWTDSNRRGKANCLARIGETKVAEATILFAVIKNRLAG